MSPANSGPPIGIGADILDTLHRLSQRYHSHGLYQESANLMAFLLRHEPARAEFHFGLGKALHAQGLHDQALHSYRRALKLGLPDIDAHLYMGQCLIFLRRFALAAAALRHFVALARTQVEPSVPASLVARGQQLLQGVVMPQLEMPVGSASHPRPDKLAPTQSPRRKTAESMESTR
jgi:tetratricopeptide (TPR) repeat protein